MISFPRGELTVSLGAIARNWRFLKSRLTPHAECGAVVKANAYGLGIERVASQLYAVGCRNFFVSNLQEALELSGIFTANQCDFSACNLFVLCGCAAGEEVEFLRNGLIPVIVSSEMLLRWSKACEKEPILAKQTSAVLKVNTGMTRLGLEENEFEYCLAHPNILLNGRIGMLMSHFACADTPLHVLNGEQLSRFHKMFYELRTLVPALRATFANSAGIFLGKEAHYDLVRPGISLYGGRPYVSTATVETKMEPVVSLKLPVIQVRDLQRDESVGYGATHQVPTGSRLAVVAGGYADGVMRSLSNRGCGYFNGQRVPIVGRVSMDSTVFDVSGVDVTMQPGDGIELLGNHNTIDDVADAAGTIGYEILTSLGDRYLRHYIS